MNNKSRSYIINAVEELHKEVLMSKDKIVQLINDDFTLEDLQLIRRKLKNLKNSLREQFIDLGLINYDLTDSKAAELGWFAPKADPREKKEETNDDDLIQIPLI